MHAPAYRILLSRHGGSRLLQALQKNRVEFLVVGGTALAFYGDRDLTDVRDLDLLVNPSTENILQLRTALADIGMFANDDEGAWHRRFNRHIPLKNPSYFCDLLTPSSVVDFETLAFNATEIDFDGVPVQVASRRSLATLLQRALQGEIDDGRRLRDLAALERIPHD